MTSLRLLRADWLKMKRTPHRWALLLAPIGFAVLIVWYFSSFRTTPELAFKIYSAFFEGWASFLPLAVGVITGLICLQEEHAGRFSAVLGSPVSKTFIYINKLVLIVVLHLGSNLISATLLLLGMKYGLHIEIIDANLFYKGVLLVVLGSLPLFVFHLWLSFAVGLGASIGLGGAGLLIAAIIGATSVGDQLWSFVPWAWPVRLVLSPNDSQVIFQGLSLALLLFVALTIVSTVWFHQWEGRKHEE